MAGGANVVARAADPRECPPVDALSAFASGQLSEQETSGVFRHLTRCATCSGLLDRLPPTVDALSGELKAAERPWPVLAEPELSRMQAAVRALPDREPPAANREHETTISSRLSTEDSAIAAPPPRKEEETVSVTPDLPARIGKYEVQSLLGKGAFGQVFLALDPELGRRVALKVPRPGMPLSQALANAFLHEARSAALLKHSGIITVYEVGQDRDYGCFIAMEYAEGGSLKQRSTGVRPPAEQAARWIAQAAEALHYAHKQRLVHRDLKPANLLLDAEGSVKVADFGLAILEEQQREHAGEFAGTLGYISPEQLRGDVHHLDGRTDIWSLGIILYELLAGRRPFTGNPDAITDDILHRPPKPPRQIDDSIPLELEQICLKCLAKEAQGRFSTAKDLAVELRRWLASLSPQPAARPARQPGWVVAVSLAAVLFLGLLVPLLAGFWNPTNAGPGSSAAPKRVAPATAYAVDTTAKRFAWVDLLNNDPRELFPPGSPTERWGVEPKREQLWIDTPNVYMIGLGETSAVNYRVQVGISQHIPTEAGLFFAFRPAPSGKGEVNRQWLLHCVTFCSYEQGKLTIERTDATLSDTPGGYSLGRRRISYQQVGRTNVSRTPLEVTFTAGLVTEVRWQGVPLLDLIARDRNRRPILEKGHFGVIVFDGAATFHEPKFMNLRGAAP